MARADPPLRVRSRAHRAAPDLAELRERVSRWWPGSTRCRRSRLPYRRGRDAVRLPRTAAASWCRTSPGRTRAPAARTGCTSGACCATKRKTAASGRNSPEPGRMEARAWSAAVAERAEPQPVSIGPIACFFSTSGHSGVDRIARHLLPGMAARGYRVDLLKVRGHGPELDATHPNLRVIDLGPSQHLRLPAGRGALSAPSAPGRAALGQGPGQPHRAAGARPGAHRHPAAAAARHHRIGEPGEPRPGGARWCSAPPCAICTPSPTACWCRAGASPMTWPNSPGSSRS
jgi:hypothetical protein